MMRSGEEDGKQGRKELEKGQRTKKEKIVKYRDEGEGFSGREEFLSHGAMPFTVSAEPTPLYAVRRR